MVDRQKTHSPLIPLGFYDLFLGERGPEILRPRETGDGSYTPVVGYRTVLRAGSRVLDKSLKRPLDPFPLSPSFEPPGLTYAT